MVVQSKPPHARSWLPFHPEQTNWPLQMACSGRSLCMVILPDSTLQFSCWTSVTLPSPISLGTTKVICVALWVNCPFSSGSLIPGSLSWVMRSSFSPLMVMVCPTFTSSTGSVLLTLARGTVMSTDVVSPEAVCKVTVPETVLAGTVT